MTSDATTRCVLLVDDDESIVAAMRMFLRVAGHRAHTAASAGAAYALVAEGLRPDAIVADYQLGVAGENGLDVVRQLRARLGRAIPAIVTTGHIGSEVAVAVGELPDCELVTKPFDPQLFVERLDALLARSIRPA